MTSQALTADRIKSSTGLGARFNHWILERVRQRRGSPTLPFTLEYRHIYVMPTMFGVWFGVLLATTLIGGLNFNNNMALLIGFLLAAIAQLTTLLAYRNLVGMELSSVRAEAAFVGETAHFRVYLRNPEARHRFALQLNSAFASDTSDIEANETAVLMLKQKTTQRGWLEMQPFSIENRFPLGMFRAWSVIIPASKCLIYPRPNPNPPTLPRSGRGDEGMARVGEGEHFHGLRKYRPGDALRSIAWRASARHDNLFTREYESPQQEACELNWYLMKENSVEEKLSILTAWILKAERQLIPYSLELPTDALPASLGPEHRDACLKLLALFGQ
ncbi:MAG: DUF58 domain-containing protein [Xanthomonadales bacterium]|nr:DUF58 domain-containing protein [Xanthomonadales bacterium]